MPVTLRLRNVTTAGGVVRIEFGGPPGAVALGLSELSPVDMSSENFGDQGFRFSEVEISGNSLTFSVDDGTSFNGSIRLYLTRTHPASGPLDDPRIQAIGLAPFHGVTVAWPSADGFENRGVLNGEGELILTSYRYDFR